MGVVTIHLFITLINVSGNLKLIGLNVICKAVYLVGFNVASIDHKTINLTEEETPCET